MDKTSYLDSLKKSTILYEICVALICIGSMLPPVLVFVLLYHPADPFHTLLEDGFEMEVKISLRFVFIGYFYAWSAFAMANTFITFLLMALLTVVSCTIWTQATLPTSARSSQQFETAQLGVMHCDHILRIYRYHQVQCNYLNAIMAKFRIALHFGILHMLFILSTYVLIRNFDMFLAQEEYELVIIFSLVVITVLLLCKLECVFIGTMVETSATMKTRLLTLSSRKHYVFKTAKSFRILVAKTTYPLFTVRNETYLEFWNVSVDHIVNLLCT